MWRRYLCRIGIHWYQYVDTGHFEGEMFEFHRTRCKFCGKESYVMSGRLV